MAKRISVIVFDQTGAEQEKKVTLNGDVFGIEAHNQVMFDAVQVYQANMRQATAKTKTRAEVSGGGKKPWRQKGTGRARAGSSRSPIWVGGGTVFGPDGRQNYKLSQNKKAHKLALKSALSDKVTNINLVLVDKLTTVKSKDFVKTMKALSLEGVKTLVVLDNLDGNEVRSMANVPYVKVVDINNVSVYDLLNAEKMLATVEAIKNLEGGLK